MHGQDPETGQLEARRRAAGELVQRLAQLARADEAFRVREGRNGYFFRLALASAAEDVWVGRVGDDVLIWPASAAAPVAAELAYDTLRGELVVPTEGLASRTALSAVAELLTQAIEGRLTPRPPASSLPPETDSPHRREVPFTRVPPGRRPG